jgi:hypothetical protein
MHPKMVCRVPGPFLLLEGPVQLKYRPPPDLIDVEFGINGITE